MGQIQSLGDFLNMMRRRIVLISAVVLLGTVASVWWVLSHPKIYEATAVAQIENPAVRNARSTDPVTATSSSEHRLRLFEQQLMARDNLIAMVDRYDLFGNTDLSMALKVARLRESIRIAQINDPNAAFGAPRVPTGMTINVTDANPEVAAALANDFLDQLVRLNRQRISAAAQLNLDFFEAEAARVEAEMSVLETQIAAFKEDNAPYLPAGVTAQRDELGTLKSTLLDLEQRLIELDASRTRQRAEVIERQSTLLRQQQALIEQRIAEIEANIASAPEVERQFGILTRSLEQLRDEYSVITRRATEAEMGQSLTNQEQFERIEVLETALVPENPVSGSRKKKAAVGAAVSLLLGVGLAFLLEIMNPVIRTPAQLERELGVKAVIAIPKLTTEQGKRHKRLFWVTLLAVTVALILSAWSVVKEMIGTVTGVVAERMRKAQPVRD
ncbi:GumC family protein [Marimonas arenosa]|uniref:Chain-length determining protein n=1 Tax=Marimonas arenosa TaxID=1795305 RepID=A0AAE3WBB5_9RHOB|nr:chain-length determining protein [Marimonas arenosa]MDQ2089348.1 chain-length determining protein [Marimonas arenosa]